MYFILKSHQIIGQTLRSRHNDYDQWLQRGNEGARRKLPHARATRFADRQHQYALCIPHCRTSQFQRTFLPSTVKLWNDLPAEVFQEDLHIFKRRCNDTLKEGATVY